jgi:hypothetical protein
MSQPKRPKRKPTARTGTRQSEPETDPLNRPDGRRVVLPKFVTLAPLTVRLRHDQVVMLAELERKIMSQRGRGQRRERITKSTIIRGLIDLLPEILTDTEGIADEGALQERLRALILK